MSVAQAIDVFCHAVEMFAHGSFSFLSVMVIGVASATLGSRRVWCSKVNLRGISLSAQSRTCFGSGRLGIRIDGARAKPLALLWFLCVCGKDYIPISGGLSRI